MCAHIRARESESDVQADTDGMAGKRVHHFSKTYTHTYTYRKAHIQP